MTPPNIILSFLFCYLLLIAKPPLTGAAGGRWQVLQNNIGITAMHMQLLNDDRVVIFDRTDFGKSNLSLPNGECRRDPNDTVLKVDCTAHSAEYDVVTNTFRALFVQTDVWCSSGAVMPDGRLIQTGGFNDGERRVRIFKPCATCDWQEVSNGLAARRWYATNHILPDGRQIIIGGRKQFNYEYYPKSSGTTGTFNFPFLAQTNDAGIENNLYPFVFLNVDGNLFVFANNRAILFDYKNNKIVKTYPQIPGGDPRCYPSTGSAVLLPLKNLQSQFVEAEVLVCGGAPKGSYAQVSKKNFVGALDTCARIKITDSNPQWVMETMPLARVMGDMTLLPNGNVLIINGAASGTAGWESGRNPVLNPVIYRPDNKLGSRFETQNPTTIPRIVEVGGVFSSLFRCTSCKLASKNCDTGFTNPNKLWAELVCSVHSHGNTSTKLGLGNNGGAAIDNPLVLHESKAVGTWCWEGDKPWEIDVSSSDHDTRVGNSRTIGILSSLCGSSRYS
ncbi:hypothetical protein CMV_017471 [Castanea mollissima]|uniref:Glyoxal oxidase N-terminal domain-containing protein n=1 Tax=Castanea mollissima TaxID=60419 RepID=A0A8J4R652_9ROSI|nr:hypothetical protein CMV_017471 [Castanea mollissima]